MVVLVTFHAQAAKPSGIAVIRGGDRVASGFVVGADGRVATALHLIAGLRAATVSLDEKTSDLLEVVHVDREHDLAVVRIAAKNLQPLARGDGRHLTVGQTLIALGGEHIVVSAIREVEPGLRLLQLSGSLAAGTAGAPLLDAHGDVVAITTGGKTVNFAMPIDALEGLLATPERAVALTDLAAPVMTEPKRNVPHHDLSVLARCPTPERHVVATQLAAAIEIGAPLFNQGNHEASARTYESVLRELERRLTTCDGVREVIREGIDAAAGAKTPTAKAWVLRDSLDGLLELMSRRAGQQ